MERKKFSSSERNIGLVIMEHLSKIKWHSISNKLFYTFRSIDIGIIQPKGYIQISNVKEALFNLNRDIGLQFPIFKENKFQLFITYTEGPGKQAV